MLKPLFKSITWVVILTCVTSPTRMLGTDAPKAKAPRARCTDGQYYRIAGSVGMPGVRMTGLPGEIISNASGHYQALIRKDAQPMVIPMKEGYEFNPKGKIYNYINADLVNQNYLCEPASYVISGSIGYANVRLRGFGRPVVTDAFGNFSATVPHGWQARITPFREGLEFTPEKIQFTKVDQDMDNQNFTARFKTVTLSGAVVTNHCPMPGVTVSTNFGGGSDVTDELGRFYVEVPYGWSGDVVPRKKGFSFNPPSLSYVNIKDDTDSIDQETSIGRTTADGKRYFFDITHRATSQSTVQLSTTFIPTLAQPTRNPTQIRDSLRVVTAIMNERLGAFAGQTQGIYVQDYGIILHSKVEPAFTFQAFPQEGEAKESGKRYMNLLRENTLKSIACTADVKMLDPNQWVVVTLAIPNTQGQDNSMTLRVRKRHVDAYAANEMNMQAFRRNVQITIQ